MLKTILFTPAIFISMVSVSQVIDTTGRERWYIERNNLKRQIIETEMELYLNLHDCVPDTAYKTKDSTLVKFISRNGKVLKEERMSFYGNRLTDSSVGYFNSKKQLLFSEGWTCASLISDASGPGEGGFEIADMFPRMLSSLIKIKYNRAGKEKVIFFMTNSIILKITSIYNSKGKLVKKQSSNLTINEFWDQL